MTGFEYIVNAKGMSFKDIAQMLDISPKTVNDWVKKRRNIPDERVKELSGKLDVPAKYLTMTLTEKRINENVIGKEIRR